MISADRIRHSVNAGIEAVTSRSVQLADDEKFADHDIDSLDSMSLMLEIEEQLGVEFKDIDPKDLETPADYIKLVQSLEDSSDESTTESTQPSDPITPSKN